MSISNISNLGDAYNWSVAKIAEAFGLNRGTVKKRLLDANTPIANMVRGNPVYALRDIGPILFGADPSANSDGIQDPPVMFPKDRKDWYTPHNNSWDMRLKILVDGVEVTRMETFSYEDKPDRSYRMANQFSFTLPAGSGVSVVSVIIPHERYTTYAGFVGRTFIMPQYNEVSSV